MPKTKLQNILFTMAMSFIMVYAMICYNISISLKGFSNAVFILAFHELPIMWPIAFILEFTIVERGAKALAFRFVKPTDRPIVIILGISSMIVCLMCPSMSLVATCLFKGIDSQLIAHWMETTIMNFPMAFAWQMIVAGPLMRAILKILMTTKETTLEMQ